MAEALWVCYACELIGTREEAEAHRLRTGHGITRLDPVTSDAVREEHAKQSAGRVTSLREALRRRG